MKLISLGTNQNCIIAGERVFYFSYNTLVAYEDNSVRIRLNGPFSRTTERHLAQMGVKEYTIVSPAEFGKLTAYGATND